MSGELDAYEAKVSALLDRIQLELDLSVDRLEGVAPRLVVDTEAPTSSASATLVELAGAVESSLSSLDSAQAALAELRQQMGL